MTLLTLKLYWKLSCVQVTFAAPHSTAIFSIDCKLPHLQYTEFSSPVCSNKSLQPRPPCNYTKSCSLTALSWLFFPSPRACVSTSLFLSPLSPPGSRLFRGKPAFIAVFTVHASQVFTACSWSADIISCYDVMCAVSLLSLIWLCVPNQQWKCKWILK